MFHRDIFESTIGNPANRGPFSAFRDGEKGGTAEVREPDLKDNIKRMVAHEIRAGGGRMVDYLLSIAGGNPSWR